MKKILILILVALGVTAVPAAAQQFFPISHIPTIQVSGRASVWVEPDRARLGMSVSEIKATVAGGKAAVDKKVLEIQQMLERQGIERKQINASQLSVHRVEQDRYPRSPQNKPEREYAYAVSRQVTVTVTDIQQLDQILDQSIKLGINQIWNIDLYSSREEEHKLEALRQAMAKARATAQAMTAEINRKLGTVHMAEHEFGMGGGPVYRTAGAMGASADGPQFSRGTIEISALVNVVYQLE